jgi:CrcB protein
MRKYLFIALGGILGAISRFLVKNVHFLSHQPSFPINTFIINITGSFVLALVLTTAYELWNFDEDIRLGIATGFLGAYTTFSTMCKETAVLMSKGMYSLGIFYIILSTFVGLFSAYLGVITARSAISGIIKRRSSGEEESEVS